MVESTAKLRQEILALSGVDIMENDNTFKSTYQILDELSLKWQDLSDIQQATITELIAGKRQGNIISSLMNNFETARSALETSLKSSGSAMREHEKWQQSLEARINSLKASWQSLSQSFLKSNFLKLLMNLIIVLVDVIDDLVRNFGAIGTMIGGVGAFKALKTLIPAIATSFKILTVNVKKFGVGTKEAGIAAKIAGRKFKEAFTTAWKSMAKIIVIMNIIKAAQDIWSWISEAGKDAETSAEKFDRISDELSSVESELNGLESELSSVESQIDALLKKDELTFADEEELSRLREVSSELEHQIQLAETLQESLNQALSATAVDAYNEYSTDTSFYSDDSKEERAEEAKALGSSIGNIAGLIFGTYLSGGNPLVGAAIGSSLGQFGGSIIGGAVSNASYDNEITVREVLDNMEYERIKLEKARDEAYDAWKTNKTDKNKEAWEEAEAALSDYNTTLAEHIQKLSEYYNSIDYESLTTEEEREKYLEMGDDLDTYNIAMGAKGAKSTAFDRIFSEEQITPQAKALRAAIEATLNSGEEIDFADFDGEQFTDIKERLADMGLTIVDVVGYFEDLKEAEEEAANNFETYEVISSIAALTDGVTALTEAFAEFNEQGIVSAKTLVELHEIFGEFGDDWTNYVDTMTNGISSIDDAREATEQLVEAYTDDLFDTGGIKFSKVAVDDAGNATLDEFGEKTYEFDKYGYEKYLSTVNQLEDLGVENAKEYVDALQQKAMQEEAARKMNKELAEQEVLLAKAEEERTEKEKDRLSELQKRTSDYTNYVNEIESSYGIKLKDPSLVKKQSDLNEYKSKLKEYQKYLNDIDSLNTEYRNSLILSKQYIGDQHELQKKWASYIKKGYGTSDVSWQEAKSAVGETIDIMFGSWMGFDIHTKYDNFEKIDKDYQAAIDLVNEQDEKRKDFFKELLTIAEESNIDLSEIDINPYNDSLDSLDYNISDADIDKWIIRDLTEDGVFNQVYEKVKTELNASVDEYEENIEGLSAEIEARLNNLGLEIDFGRNFDKIIIEGFQTKIDQFNAAKSEMFSSGGLSTDSIIAIDEIFGELGSYDSSELFENTLNGVRLNTKEFKRLSDEFKNVNIGALEDKMSDLGDQYIETRDELNKLTYGTEVYQEKARELDGIAAQIEANEELLSQYQALFSSYQEWQRAESAGSERGMYETILEGWENIDDEISRGWIDDGTREFLELLYGEKTTITKIVDGKKVKEEIDIATASAADLKQAWKEVDEIIPNTAEGGHKGYSISDFFTVDEDGNSTSQGVYNFLDAIGHMEEEMFLDKDGNPLDVVKRKDGKIIGFDFQIAGGDEAIAEALGVSEELVQIMKRAAIDAGFVVTFDGSYESLDVLKEKAEEAAVEMNKKLKAANKATIEIDMDADSVEKIQPQIDKIMETFGKKENGKLTGEIDTTIDGATEALGIVRTLQSMKDELTRPAYMDIQVSEVEEELREPLTKLQQLRTYVEQEHQLKLSGGDTTKLEKSKQEIYDYFEELDPKIKAELGLVDDKGNGITEESFGKLTSEQKIKLGYVDEDGKPITDFSEAIEKKLNDGSLTIEATIDLQLEMAESLDILALTALLEQGKISEEEYNRRISVYIETEGEEDIDALTEGLEGKDLEVAVNFLEDTNNLDGYTPEEKEAIVKYVAEHHEVDEYEPEQKQALAKIIADGTDVDSWEAEEKDALVKYVADGGDVEGWTPEEKQAWAKYLVDNGDIDNWTPEEKKAFAKYLADGGDPDKYQPPDKTATATYSADTSDPDGYQPSDKEAKVTFWASIKKVGSSLWGFLTGGGGNSKRVFVDGTANVDGTAFVNGTTGRAFKHGDWRTKESGTALVGELGAETLVRDGRYYTIGNAGAEFIKYQKGDIIFNHKQTEELFKNGRVTSGGGRAKALASGTAFINGSYPPSGAAFNNYEWDGYGEWIAPEVTSFTIGKDYSSSSSNSDSDKSQEIIDWIEVAIKRIEREIDNLDQKANNVYKTWSSRNKALADQINMVGNEIELQQDAYEAYMSAANEIGLSSEWKEKVQNGAVDIDNITDETLADKIKDYQKYFEAALDCVDAIEELKETESELYAQRFENVQTQYDAILQGYEHTESMLNEYISQAEEQGYIVSKKYYDALIANEKSNIAELKKEQADLIAARDEAVESGTITKYSEEWYNMCQEIDSVTQAIEEGTTALLEYNNAMRDIDWEIFDLVQERISDITAESEFLIELMSNKDLFDDDGKLTEQGVATVGLHALNYNTAMYQADDYAKEVAEIDKQLAQGYDSNLEERRRELIELQRESILAAEDEKNAIKDLVEEGINLELDALQEKIDLHNEELDSMKDLYDYQKKVSEQTENVANLRKTLSAYENDDSEESAKRIQELKVELESAESDLAETEMDRLIENTQKITDELYNQYSEILNSRLDNIDFLLEQVIDGVNAAAGVDGSITSALGNEGAIATALGVSTATIGETLKTEVGNVGTKLSTAMSNIWLNDGSGKAVIDLYGKDFQSKQTTTNTVLNNIKTNIDRMVDDVDKDAQKKVTANKTATSAKKNPTITNTNKNTTTTSNNSSKDSKITDDTLMGIASAIWVYGKNSGWGNNPFRENKLTDKLGASNAKKVQENVNKYGSSGGLYNFWIKKGKNLDKYKYSAFKSGAKLIDESQLAWTQEGYKQEFIVRPSDGAILTPVAKGDSVLNAAASSNIWDMANSPAEFIKDNLGIGSANVPNNSTVQSSYTQHIDNVVFRMDNVKNYEQLLSEMQKDKNFEKLILSMSIDRIAGKSSLAKGKSIR